MTGGNFVLTTKLEIGRNKKVIKFAILPVVRHLEIRPLDYII